ncbi:MAG: transglutaminase family protein [Desulfopila sp.]
MKIPPLLIGAGLLFWGVESGHPVISCGLALLAESPLFIKARFHFDEEDFIKISDLTSVILLASVAFVLLNHDFTSFLRMTASWLPLSLAPLLVAQLYSGRDTLIIGTKLGGKTQARGHKHIDFRVYYLVVCVFAAAAGNSRGFWFFPVTTVIIAVLVWCNRGRSYPPWIFIVVFIFSIGSAYLGSLAVSSGYSYAMRSSMRLLRGYYHSMHADPYKSHINFGDTGRLKYSGNIVMRVASNSTPPPLLKEASFTTYSKGDWRGNSGGYRYLSLTGEGHWQLMEPPPQPGSSISVELNLPREKGMLPQPPGSYHLKSSFLFRLEQHGNGSIKIVDGAKIVPYTISYQPSMDKPGNEPDAAHLAVPENELYALRQVYRQIRPSSSSVSARLAAVEEFFAGEFRYSLDLLGRGGQQTPLGNFLLRQKSGFCEYYATATALLLRYMGIPSRYAVGYAVHEKSELENKYIVRDRHAHAWTEAYVGGSWVVVDTTPGQWLSRDAENASFFEGLGDIFNLLKHKYTLFRMGGDRDYTALYSGMVVILTLFLALRMYRRMKMERAQGGSASVEMRVFPRVVTPFTDVLDSLACRDGQRHGETVSAWAQRCGDWQDFDGLEFEYFYRLHLKNRFDPNGLSEEHQAVLRQGAVKYSVMNNEQGKGRILCGK